MPRLTTTWPSCAVWWQVSLARGQKVASSLLFRSPGAKESGPVPILWFCRQCLWNTQLVSSPFLSAPHRSSLTVV